jgi:hypothetical protein
MGTDSSEKSLRHQVVYLVRTINLLETTTARSGSRIRRFESNVAQIYEPRIASRGLNRWKCNIYSIGNYKVAADAVGMWKTTSRSANRSVQWKYRTTAAARSSAAPVLLYKIFWC